MQFIDRYQEQIILSHVKVLLNVLLAPTVTFDASTLITRSFVCACSSNILDAHRMIRTVFFHIDRFIASFALLFCCDEDLIRR